MKPAAHELVLLGLTGTLLFCSVVAAKSPAISRVDRTLQPDRRVVIDRLDPGKNFHREDDTFLNAVGAVWAGSIGKSGAGYNATTGQRAATGFLIDQCHVLTNMHVVYDAAVVVDPPVGAPAAFAVGQTSSEKDRGALQGLKTLLQGSVVAHGDTTIIDGVVRSPDNDWAVIRLSTNVDSSIVPLSIAAVARGQLPAQLRLSSAGYPSDHRSRRGDGFKLKDLWGSDGQVVAVVPVSTMGTLLETTIQATPGNSGGPIYGNLNGQKHLVIGIMQSIRGNGIDATAAVPNVHVLFTPGMLARIAAAQARHLPKW